MTFLIMIRIHWKKNSDYNHLLVRRKFFKIWMDRYAPDKVTIPPLFRVPDPEEGGEETMRGPEDEEAARRLEEEWRQKAAAQSETYRAALAAAKRCRESDGRPD